MRLDVWKRCGFMAWLMWTLSGRNVNPFSGDFGPCDKK